VNTDSYEGRNWKFRYFDDCQVQVEDLGCDVFDSVPNPDVQENNYWCRQDKRKKLDEFEYCSFNADTFFGSFILNFLITTICFIIGSKTYISVFKLRIFI